MFFVLVTEPPKSRFCAYHIERSLYTCAVNHIPRASRGEIITSKTPAGRQATEGRFRDRAVERSRERSVERSSEGVFWMEYLHVSSDSNSFANRLSSSSYVDPPSFSVQLTADTHHPESVPGSVPESVSAGRTRTSSFHSKRQPAVAITLTCNTILLYYYDTTILYYTITMSKKCFT